MQDPERRILSVKNFSVLVKTSLSVEDVKKNNQFVSQPMLTQLESRVDTNSPVENQTPNHLGPLSTPSNRADRVSTRRAVYTGSPKLIHQPCWCLTLPNCHDRGWRLPHWGGRVVRTTPRIVEFWNVRSITIVATLDPSLLIPL